MRAYIGDALDGWDSVASYASQFGLDGEIYPSKVGTMVATMRRRVALETTLRRFSQEDIIVSELIKNKISKYM